MSETLNNIRNRPRFKLYTDLSPEDYEANLRDYIDHHKDQFFGNINKEIATIFVKKEEDNYWKPNLALRIETPPQQNDFDSNKKVSTPSFHSSPNIKEEEKHNTVKTETNTMDSVTRCSKLLFQKKR